MVLAALRPLSVLAVGDAEFQKKAIGKMQDISKSEGRTVLFVSHNMAAVKSLCTRGIVLENGKVTFEGPAEKCIDYYSTNQDVNLGFKPVKEILTEENIKITDLKILNKELNPIETVLSGEKINIVLKVNKGLANNVLHFGVGFYDREDTPQFHCSTEALQKPIYNSDGDYEVVLTIPKWPLIEGNYYINVYIKDGKKLLYHAIESYWMYCEKGDFYNTGVLPSWNRGFYCDYDWK